MKKFFEKLTGNYSSNAHVVDGTLILSLPDAVNPIVWQMELGNARASALEVRQGDDGIFMLTLKTPRGDVHDIAPFATRGRAVSALMSASRAMESAVGQWHRTPANAATLAAPSRDVEVAAKKGGLFKKILKWVAIILLTLFIINLITPSNPSTTATQFGAAGTPPASGVPMSADDYLRAMGR